MEQILNVVNCEQVQTSPERPPAAPQTSRPPIGPLCTSLGNHAQRYFNWIESAHVKSPWTIAKERSALKRWCRHLGSKSAQKINLEDLRGYALERTQAGISNRMINLDVHALGNVLMFAYRDGKLPKEPVTKQWEPLKHVTARRELVTLDEINRLVAEALAKKGELPKYQHGQFFADYIKFLAFSGARKQAALSAKWDQINWETRQLTLYSKFDTRIIVDFNPPLEAHLISLFSRREGKAGQQSPWIFPGKNQDKHLENPQHLLKLVRSAAGLPKIRFHDFRHFFISRAVMSGVDILTVAAWVGHRDGGVLISRVYGHLDPKHRRDCAARLQFES